MIELNCNFPNQQLCNKIPTPFFYHCIVVCWLKFSKFIAF